MKEWIPIFVAFFRVGALTFGGGYAMLPIIQREAIDRKNWVTEEEIMNYYAVAQCLPGIIAINTAVLVGHKIRGRAGGVAAALGVATPSLLIIMVIAAFMRNFIEIKAVQQAFYGIRIVVAALVFDAIVKMWKKGMKDLPCYCIYFIVLGLSLSTQVSTILIILCSVVAGILLHIGKKDDIR